MNTITLVNNFLKKNTDLITAVTILSIIVIIIIPIHQFLLDILLTLNLTLSLTILLLTVFSKEVLDLSTFPSLLLITTLFRVGLNISSTKLILGQGDAGSVVNAFGVVLTSGNAVVGAITFIILIIVQFVIITNGAGRVAEVAARFTLDAMPGKQMSIDADLNAGLITEAEAVARRKKIQLEAEFYGAMDGANKFVKGDAIAGIIIVIINFLGGIIIFYTTGPGGDFTDALNLYGNLTIGDGLVSQIPALLISVSSGMLITRATTDQNLGNDIAEQLFSAPKALYIVSVVLAILSLSPLPFLPFMLLSIITGVIGYLLTEDEKTKLATVGPIEDIPTAIEEEPVKTVTEEMIESARIEPLEIEIGLGLIPLASETNNKNLFERILTIRKQIAQELGLIINPIRLKDSIYIDQNIYQISIKGNKVAEGIIYPDEFLVMNPEGDMINIRGKDVVEPVFNIKATWVPSDKKYDAERYGYTVIDDVTVLITHIKEVIKQYAYELLTNQQVSMVINSLKDSNNIIVDELIPNVMSISEVTRILKNLLKEQVPINDMLTILETLAEHGNATKDIELLTEYVRTSLSRTIVRTSLTANNSLDVITLHPQLEQMIADNSQKSFLGTYSMLDPNINTLMLQQINTIVGNANLNQQNPVIVTSPKIRHIFRKLIEIPFPKLQVLSLNEIPNDIHIDVIGMVKVDGN